MRSRSGGAQQAELDVLANAVGERDQARRDPLLTIAGAGSVEPLRRQAQAAGVAMDGLAVPRIAILEELPFGQRATSGVLQQHRAHLVLGGGPGGARTGAGRESQRQGDPTTIATSSGSRCDVRVMTTSCLGHPGVTCGASWPRW
jgi:hypothetical protein